MFQTLLFWENPTVPLWRAIRHATQDDLRDLQPGISEAHCVFKEKEVTGSSRIGEPDTNYSVLKPAI